LNGGIQPTKKGTANEDFFNEKKVKKKLDCKKVLGYKSCLPDRAARLRKENRSLKTRQRCARSKSTFLWRV